MKTLTFFLAAGVLSLALAGCDRAQSPVSPTIATPSAPSADLIRPAAAKGPFIAFTKIPSAFLEQHISSPSQGVSLMDFQIDATGTKDIALTQLQFMIAGGMLDGSGQLPSGYLTNFRLLFYPKGLGGTSSAIAVNDGLGWTPGFTPDTFLRVNVTPAFAFKQNFSGVFELVADVSGAPARFQPSLQIVMVTIGGVEQPLVNPVTEDLPLRGDGFVVN